MFFKRKKAVNPPTREPAPSLLAAPGSLPEPPMLYSDAAPLLVVRFYPSALLDFDELRTLPLGMGSLNTPGKSMTESIFCGLAVDVGSAYARVTAQVMDTWNVDIDTAFDQAVTNCLNHQWATLRIAGVSHIVNDELLVPTLWLRPDIALSMVATQEEPTESGKLIMVALTRSEAFLAWDNDLEGCSYIAEQCQAAFDREVTIESVMPSRWTGTTWETVNWEELGVSHAVAQNLEVRYNMVCYSRQKLALDAWFESQSEIYVVATYIGFATKDGQVLSMASVICDDLQINVIPRTDFVLFVYPNAAKQFNVPWDLAQTVLGDSLEPLGRIPEVYKVTEVPALETLQNLSD